MQEYYSSLAGAIVSGQSDPQNCTRLAEAFGRLTEAFIRLAPPSPPIELNGDSRRQIEKTLREFLLTVKGFLYYR